MASMHPEEEEELLSLLSSLTEKLLWSVCAFPSREQGGGRDEGGARANEADLFPFGSQQLSETLLKQGKRGGPSFF